MAIDRSLVFTDGRPALIPGRTSWGAPLNGDTTGPSVSLTSPAPDATVSGAVDPGPLTAVTAAVAAAGQTQDVNRATTSTGFDLRGLASHKSGTTSTRAMSWKLSLSKACATIAVPLAPAG